MRFGAISNLFAAAAVLAVLSGTATAQVAIDQRDVRIQALEFEINQTLLRLPYYDVFDVLGFELPGKGVVRLMGQVRTGWLRQNAERSVKKIAGVDTVVNEIEILPTSSMDDRLRVALYRSLFNDTSLFRYAMGTSPSIRIIVKNGRVTLEGNVSNTVDKTMAGFKARDVFGVFEVTNNIVVAKG
jgi:hyperosmotically inducible protein